MSELVRTAPYRRHRVLWREPQRRLLQGPALPGHPRRVTREQRRELWLGDRRGSVKARTGDSRPSARAIWRRAARWRVVSRVGGARWEEDDQGPVERSHDRSIAR